jgi:hypothetical protein
MVPMGIAWGFLDPDASISITVTDPTGEDIQSARINYSFGNTIVVLQLLNGLRID